MEIAIISGKGGAGKTLISAAFATLARNVVLADCDVDASNLYLLFNPAHEEEVIYSGGYKAVVDRARCLACGLCIDHCRFDAITFVNGVATISEIFCDGCFLCEHICPEKAISMVKEDKSRMFSGAFRHGKMVYGRLAPGEENTGKLVSMVREKAKQLAKENIIQIIILDGPPGIGCPVISTISGVSKVLIVTEPSVSGFNDMIRACEMAKTFHFKPLIIINKFDLNKDMNRKIDKWCENQGLQIVGKLPFDARMVEAMVQKKSIIEYAANSEISKLIAEIYLLIINGN